MVREIDRIDNSVARLRGIATAPQQQIGSIDVPQPLSESLSFLGASRNRLAQPFTARSRIRLRSAPCPAKSYSQLVPDAMGYDGDSSSPEDTGGASLIAIEISDTAAFADLYSVCTSSNHSSPQLPGSGLGLAICRSIVDAHRGSFEPRSLLPGTTVIVELPATMEPP